MINHKEAEILISARQDAPLDPVVERELQAHLATCDECRAFAVATERLTAGIKAMPSVPVNPRTRREVMERVERGRNPLTGLFTGIGGGFQSGPVLAAAAAVLIIGMFGWLALDRLVFEDGGGDDNQIAAVPTEQPVERFVASPTQIPPTETPEPTATTVPTEEPTAEPEPTDEPEPTSEPEPTATTAPTEEPAAAVEDDDDGPTDLTTMSDPAEPEDIVEPTATVAPTEEPTQEPTEVATEAPTEEPEPTETPGIEPIDGMDVVEPETPSSTETPTGIGSGPESDDSVPIEPAEGSDVIEDAEGTIEASSEQMGTNAIEPLDAESDSEVESTPADQDALEPGDVDGPPLADVSVPYTNIAGDPSGQLALTRDGRLEFVQVPDGASRTTLDGFRLESAETQPGVIHLCGDGYCEPALDAPESDGWQGDVPLGVIGETSYFMRQYSDRTEIVGATSSGTQMTDPVVLTEVGPTSPPDAVYENDGIMFAWLSTGEWLEISGGTAQVFSGSYSNPYNLRFAPLATNGPLIGYFSNGTLVIAPVTAPDVPVFSLQTDGIDFDMTGGGSQVAVIHGNDILIYDIQGTLLQTYAGEDLQPGSLIWLNSGIVYVDRNTGALFQIPETAP